MTKRASTELSQGCSGTVNGIVPGATRPSGTDPPLLQWIPDKIHLLETRILLRMKLLDVEMIETAFPAIVDPVARRVEFLRKREEYELMTEQGE
jgi:hypothetical protein